MQRAAALTAMLCGAALLACGPSRAQSAPWVQLFGSGTSANDRFGSATALAGGGDLLLVGAPYDLHEQPAGQYLAGRAYAFRREGPSGTWTEEALLLPGPTMFGGGGGGAFGDALAMTPDGALAVVGARGTTYDPPGPDPVSEQHGAAWAFRHDTTTGEWVREGLLRDFDTQDYAQAGRAVAVSGALAAMNGGWNGRSAVVFRYTPPTGAPGDTVRWAEEATFHPGPISGFLTGFGFRTPAHADDAAEGERLVSGAFWEDTPAGADAGAVYVYRNDGPEGGSAAWALEARIEPSDAAPARGFGNAVALSPGGRLLLVGAYEFAGSAGPGRAYVYRRDGTGPASQWIEEARFTLPGATHEFGGGVALGVDPGTGAPLAIVTGGGPPGATVYRRSQDEGGGASWSIVGQFTFRAFTYTVALDGSTASGGNWLDATLGTNAGTAYVFDIEGVLTGAEGRAGPVAGGATLSVAPNPVRGPASVTLALAAPADVRVAVHDVLGREVAVLHHGPLGVGVHALTLDASPLARGVYVLRVIGAGLSLSRPVTVAR